MPRLAILAPLALLAAACAAPAPETGRAAAPEAAIPPEEATHYRCAEGVALAATYEGERAEVYWQGAVHRMETTPAASGARYRDAGLEWWTRGAEGRLSNLSDGRTLAYDCQAES